MNFCNFRRNALGFGFVRVVFLVDKEGDRELKTRSGWLLVGESLVVSENKKKKSIECFYGNTHEGFCMVKKEEAMESCEAMRKQPKSRKRKQPKSRKRWQLATGNKVKELRCLSPVDDTDEIRRLMKRHRDPEEEEYRRYPDSKCDICYSSDHYSFDCTCTEDIPKGTVLGRRYEEVCKGCGTIGSNCCKVGSYALLKFCTACHIKGHWFWEDDCTGESPWMPLLLTTDKSVEDSLKSKFISSEDDDSCEDKAESEAQKGLKELGLG